MTIKELIDKLQDIAAQEGNIVYVEDGNGKLVEVGLMELDGEPIVVIQ
jgi:hypothetical protein